MAKQRKAWVVEPGKKAKASLPGTLKDEGVDTKEPSEFDPENRHQTHAYPAAAREASQFNYITDIKTKWIGSTCYFISIYACPGPNAIAPSFEEKFARMEHIGDAKFTLSFMRHTGKWVELYASVSVDECLKAIQDDPWFQP